MRAIVQRVSEAAVAVDGEYIAKIGQGILVLVAVKADDLEQDMDYIIKKIIGLRIFTDENDKMNLSVRDIEGEILIVPQFTLYGSVIKGMRPSFMASGSVEEAEKKYNHFIKKLAQEEVTFQTGKFQADMKVSLINDGPVTIMLDSSKLF